MSQEGDQNPTAADRQVTLEGEEAEILAGMANQSTEVETLRTELLNASSSKVRPAMMTEAMLEHQVVGFMTSLVGDAQQGIFAPQQMDSFGLDM